MLCPCVSWWGGVFFSIEQTRISVSGLTSSTEVFAWRAKKWMALPRVWLNRLNEHSSVSLCRLTLAHNAFPKEASWRAYDSDLHHPCNLECRRLLSLDELAGPLVDLAEEVGHVRQRPHQRVLVVASTTLERCPVEQLHCIVRIQRKMTKNCPRGLFGLFCKQLSQGVDISLCYINAAGARAREWPVVLPDDSRSLQSD